MKIRKEVQGVIFSDNRVLLIRILDRAKDKYFWRLVKGGVEEGETEEEALRREIQEEVGLKNIKIIKKIYNYEFTFEDTKYPVSTYLVEADANEQVKLGIDGERPITDYIWVNKDRAIKLLFWPDEKEAVKLLK